MVFASTGEISCESRIDPAMKSKKALFLQNRFSSSERVFGKMIHLVQKTIPNSQKTKTSTSKFTHLGTIIGHLFAVQYCQQRNKKQTEVALVLEDKHSSPYNTIQ